MWLRPLCENPDGSPAPIDGLAFSSENAGVSLGAQGGSYCPGGLTGAQPISPSSGPYGGVWAQIIEDSASTTQATWTYTAPPGSTITGGSITGVSLLQRTWGIGTSDYDAYIASPADQPDAADLIADCASPTNYTGGDPGSNPCAINPLENITPDTVDGLGGGGSSTPTPLVATIPDSGGTQLFMTAACSTGETDPCFYNPDAGFYVTMDAGFSWADVLLSDNDQPTATGFGGSLLAPGAVAGTAHLTFTAVDPNGPGVYNVDGQDRRQRHDLLRHARQQRRRMQPYRNRPQLRGADLRLPAALPGQRAARHPRRHHQVDGRDA